MVSIGQYLTYTTTMEIEKMWCIQVAEAYGINLMH